MVVRERVHSARIGEAVTLFDPVLQQRLPGGVLQEQLPEHQVVLDLLDQSVRHQAFLMAYSDAFFLACVALAACAVAALMLRRI